MCDNDKGKHPLSSLSTRDSEPTISYGVTNSKIGREVDELKMQKLIHNTS